jgi:cytochrome b subunit of formate dehydrogenase
MDKTKINYIIDAFLAISFVITAITGILIFFFMPGGVPQGRFQELMGVSKAVWSAMHNWAGIIMMLLSLVHVILHWRWIVSMTTSLFKKAEKLPRHGGK